MSNFIQELDYEIFLAEQEYLTGQVIAIDGGMAM